MGLDWVTGALTVLGMELVGRKYWQGWAVGLANQALWAWLIWTRELWGLAPLTAILTWRYAAALIRWRREARVMLLTGILLVGIGGCATPRPATLIPVAVSCPPPPPLGRPALPIADLEPGDPPATVVKAFATSVQILQGFVEELQAILDGYRPDTPAPK
jgi:hypothetical protein